MNNRVFDQTIVILLTQAGNRSLLYRTSSFKVDDYQTKPLTTAQLTELVCTLLLSQDHGAVVPVGRDGLERAEP